MAHPYSERPSVGAELGPDIASESELETLELRPVTCETTPRYVPHPQFEEDRLVRPRDVACSLARPIDEALRIRPLDIPYNPDEQVRPRDALSDLDEFETQLASPEDDEQWELELIPSKENVRPRYVPEQERVELVQPVQPVHCFDPEPQPPSRYAVARECPRTPPLAPENEPIETEIHVTIPYCGRVRPRTLPLAPENEPFETEIPHVPIPDCARVRPRTPPLAPENKAIVVTETDSVYVRPGADAALEEAEKLAVEEKINNALKEADFDCIEQEVTAKSLTSCKTNALLKSFQVKKKLTDLIDAGSPEKEDFESLANSLDEFTCALMNPLKSDDDTRNTFERCFDKVIDTAIDTEQKKFLSHPVIFNLLQRTWYGSFWSTFKSPWETSLRWGFVMLKLWTLIDVVLYPILFALFFIVRVIQARTRKRRGVEVGFVVALSTETSKEAFALVKNTISYVIYKYGYETANYCTIQRDTERSINFDVHFDDVTSILKKVESMENAKRIDPVLHKDLEQALKSFMSSKAGPRVKKILVVFVNDVISRFERSTASLKAAIEQINLLGIQIVPVGIGEHVRLSDLKECASEIPPFHFGDYESPRTLGKTIIQAVEGKGIYEYYLEYFTTPYFIFLRDSMSYLVLLGLHFAICLSPSSVALSSLEWVIFVFFLGRILMEIDQFARAKKAEKKEFKRRLIRGSSYEVCSPDAPSETPSERAVNNMLKKLRNYFSDRWNRLDVIILLLYVITFTLRMITWGTSDDVYNNRPLAVACYMYGLIAMFLTLRVFGHMMETRRSVGRIQIALFFIMQDVVTIFWQFLATILAFSLVLTKIYIAEKSYQMNKNVVEDLACSNGGIDCWWSMTTHLSWSLLGIADLGPFTSVDDASMGLARILYSLFLIMGVILLVNMMIALLSNTYNRVEENSQKEWAFKKAITIKTYSTYHPVPVPFNLISIPVMLLYRPLRKYCSKAKPIKTAGLDEEGKKTALNKLVVKLQKDYFAKYGYQFPLTDASKMDTLLHEAEGGRKMANQIVKGVFKQRGCMREKLNSGPSAWESLGIGIEGCLLTYKGPDACMLCKRSGQASKHHAAKYLTPFSSEMPRMEVLIEESGENRFLAVGVVYVSYQCHTMPGWWEGTVGYHVDDGRIFEEGVEEFGREVKGCMAHRGDLVGCHVDFDGASKGRVPVVFSLNEREVARASMGYIDGQTALFPFIGMSYEGIRVLVKFCSGDGSPVQSSTVVNAPESDLSGTERAWRTTLQVCEVTRNQLENFSRESRMSELRIRVDMEEQYKAIRDILKDMGDELSRVKSHLLKE